MGTNECSQPASKSSWESQDFGDISMVLKMAHFCKSTGRQWVNRQKIVPIVIGVLMDWSPQLGINSFWNSHMVMKGMQAGGRLNKKDGLTRYGDSHVKDKTS